MYYTFHAPYEREEILSALRRLVDGVEKRYLVCRIGDWQLEEIVDLVLQYRAGILQMSGQYTPRHIKLSETHNATLLEVAWWHRRRVIYLDAHAERVIQYTPNGRERRNSNGIQYMQLGPSWAAMWRAAPSRAMGLASLLDSRLRRAMHAAGFKTPLADSFLLTRLVRNLHVAVIVTGLYTKNILPARKGFWRILAMHESTYICTRDVVAYLPSTTDITEAVASALRIDYQAAKRLLNGLMTDEELQAEIVASALNRTG